MGKRRYVPLDPDGMADGGLYVVVLAGTGVFYQQQYGGTACRQGQVEGYLVPVAAAQALAGLRALFEDHFRGAGTENHRWREDERATLAAAVGTVPFCAGDGYAEEQHPLRLDESRLAEADEAWIPVLTPDGPGVLLWGNSD